MQVKKNIGGLDVVEVGQGENCVVLFHGYGADCRDLAPIGEFASITNTKWIFPNGILQGPGGFGRAWFPIDENRVLDVNAKNSWHKARPAGLDDARDKALNFLTTLQIPLEKIILGGFSQGAMLACDLAFMLPPICGLVVMSGTLLDEANWEVSASSRKGRFWQCHGRYDEILPYQGAEKLFGLLNTSEWRGEFKSFDGGHEIPPTQLRQLKETLEHWTMADRSD